MRKGSREFVWTLTLLALSLTPSWSQEGGAQPPVDSGTRGSVPQSVPEPDAPQADESSSIPSSNQPSIASPATASPSYIGAGVHVSGGGESDSSATGNLPQVFPITSILGSFSLQRFRPRSETNIDYTGGATFNGTYGSAGAYMEQLHTLEVDHQIEWGKSHLMFNDSFNYLRDGNFGSSSFGGASAYDLRFAGNGASVTANPQAADYLGATQVAFGQGPFMTNVSVASFTQTLTRRSSISLQGSYSFSDYGGSTQNLYNGRQTSGQAGYNYQLNRQDSLGVVYGYQRFQFTQAGVGTITANSAQIVYHHRILTRLNLVLGAGPAVTVVSGSGGANGQQLNATAQASLQYILARSSFGISYNRLETGGYGVFAGGNTSVFRLYSILAISRRWRIGIDGGYAASTSIETISPAAPASSYDYGFAGVALQRQLGPRLAAFASYQFNRENSPCPTSQSCIPGIQQHIALIGLDWNIRPFRLD